jgi:hypothetical protein
MVSATLKTCSDVPSSEDVHKLLQSQAVLLSGLADEKRKGLRQSAFSDTRRCIRHNATFIPALLDILIRDVSKNNPSYQNTVLAGTLVDCALRLKGKKVDGKAIVEQKRAEITQFYLQSVISSKTPVPTASMVALNDFMRSNVTESDFEANFMPVLEKMMLRAPELVLRGKSRENTHNNMCVTGRILKICSFFFFFRSCSYDASTIIRPISIVCQKASGSSSEPHAFDFCCYSCRCYASLESSFKDLP